MAPRKPIDCHIKRPRNAFLCFRCDKSAVREAVRRFPDAFTEVEALGMLWKTYSEEERKPWFGMALEEAKQHAEAYPGFKHSWRKSPKKIKAQRKRQMAPRKFSGSANDSSNIGDPNTGRGSSVRGNKEMQRHSVPSLYQEPPSVALERQMSVDELEATTRSLNPKSSVKGPSTKTRKLLSAISDNFIKATPDTPNDSLSQTILPSSSSSLDTDDRTFTIQVNGAKTIDKKVPIIISPQDDEARDVEVQLTRIISMKIPISTPQLGISNQYCAKVDIANQSWNEDESAADFDYDEWLQFPEDGVDDAQA